MSVSFCINGVYDLSNEELGDDPSEKGSSKFSLEYQPNPIFYPSQREKLIKHHVGEPLTLVIHVRNSVMTVFSALFLAIE